MSKPSPQYPALAANPAISDRQYFEEWQAHVDAGRIRKGAGGGAGTTPAQLLRHMRNEEVLLGKAVSVRVHVREELRGR